MFLYLYSDTHPHYVTINPWLVMLQSILFLSNQLWWHNQVPWNSFNAPSILIYIYIYPPCMSLYMFQLYIYIYICPIHIQVYIYICRTIIKLLYTVSIAPVFLFETPLKFDEVITQMIHFFLWNPDFDEINHDDHPDFMVSNDPMGHHRSRRVRLKLFLW